MIADVSGSISREIPWAERPTGAKNGKILDVALTIFWQSRDWSSLAISARSLGVLLSKICLLWITIYGQWRHDSVSIIVIFQLGKCNFGSVQDMNHHYIPLDQAGNIRSLRDNIHQEAFGQLE